MAKFTDYTQKTKPADADLLLIHDNAGAANKKTPFSGVWSWILDKLASAVISQLETTNKSIIPAINELNSKSLGSNVKLAGFVGREIITISGISNNLFYGSILVCLNTNNVFDYISINSDKNNITHLGGASSVTVSIDRDAGTITINTGFSTPHGFVLVAGGIAKNIDFSNN